MNNGWLKVRSVAIGGTILGLIGFATVAKISATATYDYKPGQFLVIDGGKSPDKQFAIVSGEDKSGNFGVQLMDAKTKKLIGPLEEVATELDSAPDAYRAHWSPDSKHVGISSREDRHLLRNVIYRIENRRAYLVETPQLLCHAVPDFCQLQKELSGALMLDSENYYDAPWKVRQNEDASEIIKWISPTRFIVSEESQWQVKERDPTAAIGQYGDVEEPEHETGEARVLYHVWFNAEGECELLPGDKSRVISTHPVKK
jgi:hypothetical protein